MSFKGWKNYRLGDLTEWRSGGTPFKSKEEFWNGDIPWISAKSLNSNEVYDSELRITKKGLENGSRLASVDSILLLVRGSGLFNRLPVAIVTKPVAFNQDVKSIEVCKDKVRPRFLLYWFEGNKTLLYTKLEETGIGAGKFDLEIIQNLTVNLPPLIEQDKIISFIKAIDDKIDLNRQTNQTLKAIAQALFKEWFVEFNFPGATGEMQESELGEMPKGWKVVSFEEELEAVRGLSYKGAGLVGPGAMPMHNLNSVYELGGYKFEGIKYYNGDFKDKHTVNPGDLIIANTEQGHKYLLIGYPAIVTTLFGDQGIFSHHLYRLKAKRNSYLTSEYLYHLLLQPGIREQVVGFANGTTVNMLKIEGLQKPKFALPPKELVLQYTIVASNFRSMQEENIKQNQTLTQLRDSLLPKLMKGEINIA